MMMNTKRTQLAAALSFAVLSAALLAAQAVTKEIGPRHRQLLARRDDGGVRRGDDSGGRSRR